VVVSRIEGKPGDFAAPSVLLKVEKPEETNRRDAESAEIRHAEKRE
jgi:hypothetical protein